MEKVKILIVDDHKMVREGLIACLNRQQDIKIIGEASGGEEAIQKTRDLKPDVVLMDFGMPDMNGLEATKIISKNYPASKVLVLTAHNKDSYVTEFVQAGAKGYVLKDSSTDELAKAIIAVNRGEAFFSAGVSQIIFNDYVRSKNMQKGKENTQLSEREKEVLKYIAEGYSTDKIASTLCLSAKTVKAHREHIMRKLGIHSANGLTKYAIKTGLISVK